MEDLEIIEPVQVPEYLDEYIEMKSPGDVEEIDYSSYYEQIISNQEILIANQEVLIKSNADLLNAALGCDNVLVLTIIVFAAFWLVKEVFIKFFL